MAKRKLTDVPEQWRFVEGEVPGCHSAWVRDVNGETPKMLGVSGSRKRGTYGVTAWQPGQQHYWRLLATEMCWVKKEVA